MIAVARLAALVAGSMIVAACTDAAAPADGAVEPLDTLTACVAPTPRLVEPGGPLGFQGLDVDVLIAVAAALDRELELVDVAYDELVSGVALNGLRCELGAAGIVDGPGLDVVVRTSEPYREVDRLVVSVGAATTSPGDVAAVEGAVGLVDGGPAQDVADELTGAELRAYPSRTDLERALVSGELSMALVTVEDHAALLEDTGLELGVVATAPAGWHTVLVLPLSAEDEFLGAVDEAISAWRDGNEAAAARDRLLVP